MKSGAYPSPFAGLPFPNSKKVPIYCWVDRERFPVVAWRIPASIWLVGCFWALRPFETVFQSISGRLPKRGGKRRERIDESKKCPNNPHPCPTLIQTSRTPRHWKFTQDHRTTRPPPPPQPRIHALQRISAP